MSDPPAASSSTSSSSPFEFVVKTGATSGIGAFAVNIIAAQPNTRVIVGARGAGEQHHENVEFIHLDLSSLASVRSFAAAVQQRISSANCEVTKLVLNAAAQFHASNIPSTIDGFEPTFAINHLAHYLLARLLLPHLAVAALVIITTSDTHDPAVLSFAPKFTHLDGGIIDNLAHPKSNGGFQAYPASKLCNIMTARSLAGLADVQLRRIQVIAYNPGLTMGTQLWRNMSAFGRGFMRCLGPVLICLSSKFNLAWYAGKPERAGEVLASLTLGTLSPSLPEGRLYASLVKGAVTFPDPSVLARDDEACALLWQQSQTMVGL